MSLSNILQKYSKGSSNLVCVNMFESPMGKLIAAADEDYLYLICFEDSKKLEPMLQTLSTKISCKFVEEKNKILQNFESELSEYFAGNLKNFTIPIKTMGSDFQKDVWQKLQGIPYGSTQTYGDLAKAMGRAPSHARAVGAACGANTHVLVIPCHRLVASGSKGGFSCGVDRKEWLLNHEKKFVT